MGKSIRIKNALVSVYHKDKLEPLLRTLHSFGVSFYSTGGTFDFIEKLGLPVQSVESLTSYPSILGGRVKTLHPKVFGGILSRRSLKEDKQQLEEFKIPEFDLVIVDLYPFEETVASGASEEEVIEKIDIGGISLIRAGAKNYRDVLIISSREQYERAGNILHEKKGGTDLEDRKQFALEAFGVSSHYDTAIFNWFSKDPLNGFRKSLQQTQALRYGENPHQKGFFHGDLETMFEKLNGKELSYNNLLDVDAAVHLIGDFLEPTFAILKHNNACGIASRTVLCDAWKAALEADPLSAFGGILISNQTIDPPTANEISKLFFEVIIAPGFEPKALETLRLKQNRIILQVKPVKLPSSSFRTILNGVAEQEKDLRVETKDSMKPVTKKHPSAIEFADLEFANKVVKHTKSNTIVLVKDQRLLASGTGQTSRVDALNQAIAKALHFGFDLKGAVMASDAFFPFPDCVEIAQKAGITAVVQPGGSIKDKDSIAYCDANNLAMVFTGIRHFKH